MKLSVSLTDVDVAFIDEQTRLGLFDSRSGAIRAAVELLRVRRYTDSYAAAWDEWDESGDAAAWDGVVADGLVHDVSGQGSR